MDVEPRPTRARAGQVVTRTHQRLINLAIDSLQEDDYSGLPDLETDDDEQESGNVVPQFEVQDDSMIEFMHNINIMYFPDEIIRTNKQTGQIVPDTHHLNNHMIEMVQKYMRGDATRMETYIDLGAVVYEFKHCKGNFCQEQINHGSYSIYAC